MSSESENKWVPNELFITLSFVAFILCVLPFPFYLRARNVGTTCYAFWAGLACLNSFINASTWNHNVVDWAPVWCDISTRITLTENVSLSICSFVINRRLYWLAMATSVNYDRRRAIGSDLLLCLGVPVLQAIVALVPAGKRFSIYEDIGCKSHIMTTWVSILLFNSWPLLINIASAYYCTRCFIVVYRRRRQIKQAFPGEDFPNQRLYVRLLTMSATEIVFTIPFASLVLWLTTQFYQPWVSWAAIHADYFAVEQVTAAVWHSSSGVPVSAADLELSRWFKIFAAFWFFGFYGLAGDFRGKYKVMYLNIVGMLGIMVKSGQRHENTQGNVSSLVFASHATRMKQGGQKTTHGSESETLDVEGKSVASHNDEATTRSAEITILFNVNTVSRGEIV